MAAAAAIAMVTTTTYCRAHFTLPSTPHPAPMATLTRRRTRLRAAEAAVSSTTIGTLSPTSSSKCRHCHCHRRYLHHTLRQHSIANKSYLAVVVIIAMFHCVPHVLPWTLSIPTIRRHQKQGRHIHDTIIGSKSMLVYPTLSAMASDDNNEHSNNGDDNGDSNIGADEAAIMDIANALIQTSSPPTTMIASDENNGIDGVDAIETFMNKATEAWTDGLSEGNTDSSMLDSEVLEAAAAAEEGVGVPKQDVPYFTSLPNTSSISGDMAISNNGVGENDDKSKDLQQLDPTPNNNVDILKGAATKAIASIGQTLFSNSKGVSGPVAETNLSKGMGISGKISAQPLISPLKSSVMSEGFPPPPPSKMSIESNSFGKAGGEISLGKTSTTPKSPLSLYDFPVKGMVIEAKKSPNMLGSLKKSFTPLEKGGVGVMKANTGTTVPLPKMDGLKKGLAFGEMKSKSMSFPPPPMNLKGTQTSGPNVETESPSMKKSPNPDITTKSPPGDVGSLSNKSLLPKISQIDKQAVGVAKSGSVVGRTLPFMKKSGFISSPSKITELNPLSSKGIVGVGGAAIDKGLPPPPLKSPIDADTPQSTGGEISTDATKMDAAISSPPFLKSPLKGSVPGATKFSDMLGPMKKSLQKLDNGGIGKMKAKTGNASFSLLNADGLKKGMAFGELNSKITPFPLPPQPLKGTQSPDRLAVDDTPADASTTPPSLKGMEGAVFGTTKSSDMLGPMNKSFSSLKGGIGEMKAKTGTTTLPKVDGLKKELSFGELKSKSTTFPPSPLALKGFRATGNVETELASNKPSMTPPVEIGTLSDTSPPPKVDEQLISNPKTGGVGRGTLPFMKKSPFTSSPSKSVDLSSFSAKGKGGFPTQLKGADGTTIGKGYPPPPLKSPINDDTTRLDDGKISTDASTTDAKMSSPPFLTAPLKGSIVGATKSSNMLGEMKKYLQPLNKGDPPPDDMTNDASTTPSPSVDAMTGAVLGTTKTPDMLGPMKKSLASLKGGIGEMKAKTGTTTLPNLDGLKKGLSFGELKSKSTPVPMPPQALKGIQAPGANVETESTFIQQSSEPDKTASPVVQSGNLSNRSQLPQFDKESVGNPKSNGVVGGTLPFMKKSPFISSPSKTVELSSFSAKGKGGFPTQLKGVGVGDASIGKGFPPPPLKSPTNGDTTRLDDDDIRTTDATTTDATTSVATTTDAITTIGIKSTPPFPKAPLKGSTFGATKDMLGPMKKSLQPSDKGGAREMKAKTGTASFSLPNVDGLKNGLAFGALKSKSTPFPLSPQTLKGTQTSDPLAVGGSLAEDTTNDTSTSNPTLHAMKGAVVGRTKSSDMLGISNKSIASLKGGIGEMKAKTGTMTLPNLDGLKKGLAIGEMKSKSMSFPPPPMTLKGTQTSGANAETEFAFVQQSLDPDETASPPVKSGNLSVKSLLPKFDKELVGNPKTGGMGGGTLPFMKKSGFTSSPSKSVELNSFSAKGKGGFPTQLKGAGGAAIGTLPPLKSPIDADTPRLADGDELMDDTTASPPPLKAPLKGSVFGDSQSSSRFGEKSSGSFNIETPDLLAEKSNIYPETVDDDLIYRDEVDKVVDALVEDFDSSEEDRNGMAKILQPRASDRSSIDWQSPPPKTIGTGGSFTPKAFTPPKVRPTPKTLDIVDGFIDLDSWKDESNSSQEERNESFRQVKQPKNIWTGESFYGTASSRVYGLGADNIDIKRRGDMKTPLREEREPVTEQANNFMVPSNLGDENERIAEETTNLIREKARVASLLADAERKLADQLRKIEEERRETKELLAIAARDKAAAEKRASKLEATLMKDVRFLERRLADEIALAKLKLKEEQEQRDAERDRARVFDEARWIERFNEEENLGSKRTQLDEDKLMEKFNHLLESKLEERLAELRKDRNVQGNVPADPTEKLRTEINLPQKSDTSEPTSSGANMKESGSDSLATDVKELDIVSMSFDPKKSPFTANLSVDDVAESCWFPTEYPFVSLLRDSSPYIVNHRHSTIVYHIPGDLISNQVRFNSVMDDISLTYLFGMKIVICVGCRKQILQRLENLRGRNAAGVDQYSKVGVRVTDAETLRILEEEAGFCRFEVERLLNRCLRNKGADCNVVSGCFITAQKFGVIDGVDYQHTGYPKTLQTDRIHSFLARNDVVLLTPLGFSTSGNALNIHSEALAAFTAGALEASKLVYFATNPMILRGSTDANRKQRIQMMTKGNALQILLHYGLHVNSETGFPHWDNILYLDNNLDRDQQSMLLKMGWASMAIERGVERAHIIDSEDGALLEELFTARRGFGTCISQDDYEAPHPEDWNDDFSVADGVTAGGLIEW